jgi:hypothetical protein
MPLPSEHKERQDHSTGYRETIDDWFSVTREGLKASLDDIASKVRAALDRAGLATEVFFTIPSSGEALMTFATPTDPSDQDWAEANQIICDVVGEIVGIEGLRSRSLPCTASGISMGAADVGVAGGPVAPSN